MAYIQSFDQLHPNLQTNTLAVVCVLTFYSLKKF